jgi:hypothetical protein
MQPISRNETLKALQIKALMLTTDMMLFSVLLEKCFTCVCQLHIKQE